MNKPNAFTAKPDLSEWIRKQAASAQLSENGRGGPKVPTAHIQILGKRRYGQIKDWK